MPLKRVRFPAFPTGWAGAFYSPFRTGPFGKGSLYPFGYDFASAASREVRGP